jgi:hypothetical protein
LQQNRLSSHGLTIACPIAALGYVVKTRRKSAVTSIKLVGNVIYGVSSFPTDGRLSFRFFKYGLVVEVLNQIASCFAFVAQERERIG